MKIVSDAVRKLFHKLATRKKTKQHRFRRKERRMVRARPS